MTKNSVLLTMMMTLIVHLSFSNGGPIDGSAVYQSGDIVLINQPNIDLIKEDLKIKIDGDYSIVHVTYLLINEGTDDQDVVYGFPIDFIETDWAYELKWDEQNLTDFGFYLNGNSLKTEGKTDAETKEVTLKDFQGEPYQVNSKRRWNTTKFSISASETTTLEVKYKLKNGFTDWGTSKDFFPTFDSRSLVYDFTPAQFWGDGIVNSLSVSVDLTKVFKNKGTATVSGFPMQNTKGLFLYNATNYNLTDSKNLQIEYTNVNEGMSRFAWDHQMPKSKLMNVTVSSQLKGNYVKDHMFDGNFSTAWVEGKTDNGVNEQIVIELDDYNLAAIGIVGGYAKSPSIYQANNRVKRIRLEREIVSHGDPTKTSIASQEVVLKDLPFFNNPRKDNFHSMLNVVGEYGEGFQKIRKITITILDTYPGTKYNDTCISEIFLMGYQWK